MIVEALLTVAGASLHPRFSHILKSIHIMVEEMFTGSSQPNDDSHSHQEPIDSIDRAHVFIEQEEVHSEDCRCSKCLDDE